MYPVARYRFAFRMQDDLDLPDYAGSLLRGQFGAALRRTVCMTNEKNCAQCPLYRSCPYPAIFETPPPPEHALQSFSAVPNPYVIEPPPLGTRRIRAGEELAFGVVLFGQALRQLPIVTHALQRALSAGLGRNRARGALANVLLEGPQGEFESIWDQDSGQLCAHDTMVSPPPHIGDSITLEIVTPLRLQQQGRPIRPDALRPRALVTALLRRVTLLTQMHAGREPAFLDAHVLAEAAERLAQEKRLQWHDWTRYSTRQNQEMILGGVVGSWRLQGELAQLYPWLWLGQWIHVGKNATMGLGHYRLAA